MKNGLAQLSSWPEVTLGQACSVVRNGFVYDHLDREGVAISRIETNSDGTINRERVGRTPWRPELASYSMETGDILCSHINSLDHLGKVAIYSGGEPLFHGMNLPLLRPDPKKAIPAYLLSLLRAGSVRRQVVAMAKKAVAQVSMSSGEVKSIRLPLPPLPEQRRIAEILSAWDSAIEQTEKLIAAKERVKRGLLVRALVGIGHPASWHRIELAVFVSLGREKVHPDQAPPSMECIELEHLGQGTGQQIGFVPIGSQASLKNRFQSGDVLFGNLRPHLRKSLLVRRDGACSSEIWVLRPDQAKCVPEYLAVLVQSEEFVRVACATCGSKMPRADWDWVSEHPFPLPPLAEQRRIAEVLNVADAELVQLRRRAGTLQRQKQGLMQVLLTGKIRVRENPSGA